MNHLRAIAVLTALVAMCALAQSPVSAAEYQRTIRLSEHQYDVRAFCSAILDTVQPGWRNGDRTHHFIDQMNYANWLTAIRIGNESTREKDGFEVKAHRPSKKEYVVVIRRWSKTSLSSSQFGGRVRNLARAILSAVVPEWGSLEGDRKRSAIEQVQAALARIQAGSSDTLHIDHSEANVRHLPGGDYQILIKTPLPVVEERNVTANPCPKCDGTGWVYRTVGKVRRGQPSKVQRYTCPTCHGSGRAR